MYVNIYLYNISRILYYCIIAGIYTRLYVQTPKCKSVRKTVIFLLLRARDRRCCSKLVRLLVTDYRD